MDFACWKTGLAMRDGKGARALLVQMLKPFSANPLLTAPVGREGAQRRLRKATGMSVKAFAFSPPSLAGRGRAGRQ